MNWQHTTRVCRAQLQRKYIGASAMSTGLFFLFHRFALSSLSSITKYPVVCWKVLRTSADTMDRAWVVDGS